MASTEHEPAVTGSGSSEPAATSGV